MLWKVNASLKLDPHRTPDGFQPWPTVTFWQGFPQHGVTRSITILASQMSTQNEALRALRALSAGTLYTVMDNLREGSRSCSPMGFWGAYMRRSQTYLQPRREMRI